MQELREARREGMRAEGGGTAAAVVVGGRSGAEPNGLHCLAAENTRVTR